MSRASVIRDWSPPQSDRVRRQVVLKRLLSQERLNIVWQLKVIIIPVVGTKDAVLVSNQR